MGTVENDSVHVTELYTVVCPSNPLGTSELERGCRYLKEFTFFDSVTYTYSRTFYCAFLTSIFRATVATTLPEYDYQLDDWLLVVFGMIDSAIEARFAVLLQPGVCRTVGYEPLSKEMNVELLKIAVQFIWIGLYNFYDIHGVAIKKLDCFYYSFPATSMTKRRVGHWPVDFPLPSHKVSYTCIG